MWQRPRRRRPASVSASALLLLLLGGATAAGLPATLPRLVDGRDPVGSPGEIAWQAWLLLDSGAPLAGDHREAGAAATVTRRIAPKSVFIAPSFSPQALPACAEGYRADAMGRCVKLVKVNQAAQLDFFLQRLNAMYAARPQPRPPPPPDAPMQVPLSLSASIPNLEVQSAAAASKPPTSTTSSTTSTTMSTTTTSTMTSPTTSTTTSTTTTTPTPSTTARSTTPASRRSDEAPEERPEEESVGATPATPQAAGGGDALQETEVPLDLGGDAPVLVSVVMADVNKRSSSEEAEDAGGKSTDGGEDSRPVVTLWTIKNKTVQQRPAGEAFAVEIEEEAEPEAAAGSESAPAVPGSTLTTPAALAQVLAPTDVKDAFPMLIISPGPPASTPAPPPAAPAPAPASKPRVEPLGIAHNSSSNEGSGETAESVGEAVTGAGAAMEEMEVTGAAMEETEVTGAEDEGETGSADAPERVEAGGGGGDSAFPNPPALLPDEDDQETAFSQGALAGGGADKETPPRGGFVRFPSDDEENNNNDGGVGGRISLFKGDFIKFPPEEDTYRYEEGETDPPLPPDSVRRAFWWLPEGWRVEGQQRPSPEHLRDFWSRFPLNDDPALLARYGAPSYYPRGYAPHPPHPLRQRRTHVHWPETPQSHPITA